MTSKRTYIINQTGLHARPASNFVATAKKFKSRITIQNISAEFGKEVDAKSIFAVLGLGLFKGIEVQITADGEDEKDAVSELVQYIENCIDE